MVTILRPSAARTVVTQETAGLPSRSTVHDPHWPSPQPYFVPVNPKSSRSTSSRGRSGSVSILSALPLTDNRIVAIETSYQFAPFLPAVACEGYPTVCASMIFCSGRRCRALASASRPTMARITVEKPSEAQYRYTFCPIEPVSAAEYSVLVVSGVSAILAKSATYTRFRGACATNGCEPVAARRSPGTTSSRRCSLALYRYTASASTA